MTRATTRTSSSPQLHLLFIRFHNRVVEHVRERKDLAGAALLREAQRIVRWHYQWIVAHDFLRRIVGRPMADSVLEPAERRFYRWGSEPFIPVEFSGAAYRFGHSMVRNSYKLNADLGAVGILASDDDAGELEHLGGFRSLPAPLTIDWGFFYELRQRQRPQLSRRIDTDIAGRLSRLPAGASATHEALPRLNLLRGRALGLPAGSAVARAMGVTPLADDQLLPVDMSPKAVREAVLEAPPLWYYVLCEAASELGGGGRRLGPVGGRIVAEVLVGLIEADPHSYLRQRRTWTPELDGEAYDDFTMADLVTFVQRPG